MITLSEVTRSFLHLLFPHLCVGCGSDQLEETSFICLSCRMKLPRTQFHLFEDNPAEKKFWGRTSIVAATAQYFYTKSSLIQKILYEFKYHNHVRLGFYLGRLMGFDIIESNRFNDIEIMVPLPLHKKRQRMRGFNQSEILCKGIASVFERPIVSNAIIRKSYVASQTRKNRVERWQNLEDIFEIKNAGLIENKHILLVDDVITTGSTLESCCIELMKCKNVTISIACFCITNKK